MLGRIEAGRRREWQRMRWLAGITESLDMSLSKLRSWWWTRRPGMLQSTGSQRVGHDWPAELNWNVFLLFRQQPHPTPVLLPGNSHGRRSLVGYSPWGCKESDTTERLHFHALEKEMATHSSILAWRIPGTGAWWTAVYGVTQSWTRLTWLSSSSSSRQQPIQDSCIFSNKQSPWYTVNAAQ